MHIKGNLVREYKLFLFQLKNIKGFLTVPFCILFVLIPFILVLTMEKFEDIDYVRENFVLLTQYFVPLLSVWGISFSFIDLVENEGEEIHYINHRMKDNIVLIWIGVYFVIIAIGFFLANIWIANIWMEYIRLIISCCFYTSVLYCSMYGTNSMTLSFLAIILYWLCSVFGNQIPLDLLNCYDTRIMTFELLITKYIYIMIAAIIIYSCGYLFNKRKQKYH